MKSGGWRQHILDLSELQALRRIWPLLRLYPWALPLLVGLGILSSLLEWLGIALMIPLLQSASQISPASQVLQTGQLGAVYRLLMQLFAGLPASQRTLLIALFILGAILLKAVAAYGHGRTNYWLRESIVYRARCQAFAQLLRLGPAYLDQRPAAQVLELLFSATQLAGFAVSYFAWLLIDLCKIAIFATMLMLLSWRLTLLVAVSMVAISRLSRLLTRRVDALSREKRSRSVELKARMVESISGLATIRTFGSEALEERRHRDAAWRLHGASYALQRTSVLVDPVNEGLAAALLVVLMVGAIAAQMPVAILVSFVFMLYRLQPQTKSFERNRVQLVANSVGAEEVLEFLDPRGKSFVRAGDTLFSGLKQGIELRAAGFQYATRSAPALSEVSLFIAKGRMTALVGPSGAGKSTIIHLLSRFFDVTSGEILVDGAPLSTLELDSWRRRIAVVSQDPFLFHATVRENIAYGRPDATEQQILDAARQAHADEFICELPQGYDTLIGDRGVRLSGGQRQRLAIARAILTGAELLILDEATNQLDGLSESYVYETIRSLRGQRTVLAIAHRLSTIEEADHIVVLEEGRVAQQGSRAELLQQGGLFASLQAASGAGELVGQRLPDRAAHR